MRIKKSGLAGLRGDRRKKVEVFLKFSCKYDLCSRVSYFLEYGNAGFLEAERFIETKGVFFFFFTN